MAKRKVFLALVIDEQFSDTPIVLKPSWKSTNTYLMESDQYFKDVERQTQDQFAAAKPGINSDEFLVTYYCKEKNSGYRVLENIPNVLKGTAITHITAVYSKIRPVSPVVEPVSEPAKPVRTERAARRRRRISMATRVQENPGCFTKKVTIVTPSGKRIVTKRPGPRTNDDEDMTLKQKQTRHGTRKAQNKENNPVLSPTLADTSLPRLGVRSQVVQSNKHTAVALEPFTQTDLVPKAIVDEQQNEGGERGTTPNFFEPTTSAKSAVATSTPLAGGINPHYIATEHAHYLESPLLPNDNNVGDLYLEAFHAVHDMDQEVIVNKSGLQTSNSYHSFQPRDEEAENLEQRVVDLEAELSEKSRINTELNQKIVTDRIHYMNLLKKSQEQERGWCVGCKQNASLQRVQQRVPKDSEKFVFEPKDVYNVEAVLRSDPDLAKVVDKLQNEPLRVYSSVETYIKAIQKRLNLWIRGQLPKHSCSIDPPKLSNPPDPTIYELTKLAHSLVMAIPFFYDPETDYHYEFLVDTSGKHGLLGNCVTQKNVGKKARKSAINMGQDSDNIFSGSTVSEISSLDQLNMLEFDPSLAEAGLTKELYQELSQELCLKGLAPKLPVARRMRLLFQYSVKNRLKEIRDNNMTLQQIMAKHTIYRRQPDLLHYDFQFYMNHYESGWPHADNTHFISDSIDQVAQELFEYGFDKVFGTLEHELGALMKRFRNGLLSQFGFDAHDYLSKVHEFDFMKNEVFILAMQVLMYTAYQTVNAYTEAWNSVFVCFSAGNVQDAINDHLSQRQSSGARMAADAEHKKTAAEEQRKLDETMRKRMVEQGIPVSTKPLKRKNAIRAPSRASIEALKSTQPFILVKTEAGSFSRQRHESVSGSNERTVCTSKMKVHAVFLVLNGIPIQMTECEGSGEAKCPLIASAFAHLYYAVYALNFKFPIGTAKFFDYFNQVFKIQPGHAYTKVGSTTGHYSKTAELRVITGNKRRAQQGKSFHPNSFQQH